MHFSFEFCACLGLEIVRKRERENHISMGVIQNEFFLLLCQSPKPANLASPLFQHLYIEEIIGCYLLRVTNVSFFKYTCRQERINVSEIQDVTNLERQTLPVALSSSKFVF